MIAPIYRAPGGLIGLSSHLVLSSSLKLISGRENSCQKPKIFGEYDSEGLHIYRKDGWYYLLIAEGGTFEHHMLCIARSKSIWDPSESYERNPILTLDGSTKYIQNTGRGELFQDSDGAWWAVVLGVRDEQGSSPMGRETFLTPVT